MPMGFEAFGVPDSGPVRGYPWAPDPVQAQLDQVARMKAALSGLPPGYELAPDAAGRGRDIELPAAVGAPSAPSAPARAMPAGAPPPPAAESSEPPGAWPFAPSIPAPAFEADDASPITVDRSRGTSGAEWAAEHAAARAPRLSTVDAANGEDYWRIRGLQDDLDRRYGSDAQLAAGAFDPVEAQLRTAVGAGNLRTAQERAANPTEFALREAALPERARTAARLQATQALSGLLQGFEDRVGAIQDKRRATQASPIYQNATAEARKRIDDLLDREEGRIQSTIRLLQQSMGFAFGATPSSLYSQNPFGG